MNAIATNVYFTVHLPQGTIQQERVAVLIKEVTKIGCDKENAFSFRCFTVIYLDCEFVVFAEPCNSGELVIKIKDSEDVLLNSNRITALY